MQQRSFGRMGTVIWSPGGVMGVRKHSMYRRCLQLAWWRMEPILCVGKGVLPNLRTVPTSGRLSFFSSNSFFLWNEEVKSPSFKRRNKRVCFVLTSHKWNMAGPNLLVTTSCTMKCCELEIAMTRDTIHAQIKMFWQNFSRQLQVSAIDIKWITYNKHSIPSFIKFHKDWFKN